LSTALRIIHVFIDDCDSAAREISIDNYYKNMVFLAYAILLQEEAGHFKVFFPAEQSGIAAMNPLY
jgi:hypothetical protein